VLAICEAYMRALSKLPGGGGGCFGGGPGGGPGGFGTLAISTSRMGPTLGRQSAPSVSLDLVESCRLNVHACIHQRG